MAKKRLQSARASDASTPGKRQEERRAYAVKAEVRDPKTKAFVFENMKTMYGGKHVAEGDMVFVFASETEGGSGVVARGVVTDVEAVPPKAGIARQTPRVSIWVKHCGAPNRRLGRMELKAWRGISDGSGEAELDFKLYRQATNKVVGLEERAVRVLLGCFSRSK